jgi:hypothetical protein
VKVTLSVLIVVTMFFGCKPSAASKSRRNQANKEKFDSEVSGRPGASSGGTGDESIFCQGLSEDDSLDRSDGALDSALEGKTIMLFDTPYPSSSDHALSGHAISSCVDFSTKSGRCVIVSHFEPETSLAGRCHSEFSNTYFGVNCVGTKENGYKDPNCKSLVHDGCSIVDNEYVKNKSMKFDGTRVTFVEDGNTLVMAKIVPKGSCRFE